MEPNPAELLLHIFGVIGVFVGYGTLLLATTALGRARKIEEVRAIAGALTAGRRIGFEQISLIDVIVVAAVLVVGITGLDMGRYTGDWYSGWVPVAIVSFLLLAPRVPRPGTRLARFPEASALGSRTEFSALLSRHRSPS